MQDSYGGSSACLPKCNFHEKPHVNYLCRPINCWDVYYTDIIRGAEKYTEKLVYHFFFFLHNFENGGLKLNKHPVCLLFCTDNNIY